MDVLSLICLITYCIHKLLDNTYLTAKNAPIMWTVFTHSNLPPANFIWQFLIFMSEGAENKHSPLLAILPLVLKMSCTCQSSLFFRVCCRSLMSPSASGSESIPSLLVTLPYKLLWFQDAPFKMQVWNYKHYFGVHFTQVYMVVHFLFIL